MQKNLSHSRDCSRFHVARTYFEEGMADRGISLHTDGDSEEDAGTETNLSQGQEEDRDQVSVPARHPPVPRYSFYKCSRCCFRKVQGVPKNELNK